MPDLVDHLDGLGLYLADRLPGRLLTATAWLAVAGVDLLMIEPIPGATLIQGLMLGVALLVALVTYVLFTRGLGLTLPPGVLQGIL